MTNKIWKSHYKYSKDDESLEIVSSLPFDCVSISVDVGGLPGEFMFSASEATALRNALSEAIARIEKKEDNNDAE